MRPTSFQSATTNPSSDALRTTVVNLAQEFDLPFDHVERLYFEQSSLIEKGARITTYVPVIVASRVRAELQRQRYSR
jgi:hypothetical protein